VGGAQIDDHQQSADEEVARLSQSARGGNRHLK